MLLQQLPRDSALARAVHGEAADWGVSEHLLAAAVDHLAAGNWLFAAANSPEHATLPEQPEPVPRPGLNGVDEQRSATPEEIAAFLGGTGG